MNATAWAILFGVAFAATLALYLLTGMRLRELEEERKALRDVDHGGCEEYEEGQRETSFFVRLDLRYVENWSLSLDLVILLRTKTAVVRSSGAY